MSNEVPDPSVPPLLAPLHRDLARWPSPASDRSITLADTDTAYSAIPPYARARFFLVGGSLYKARARCVYRRDEVTAWALTRLLKRYPDLPDFDVVLNCRDGPLLRRPPASKPGPLVLSYSAIPLNAEIAFPDYTLWGLPGKLKPWKTLRRDLLHRTQRSFLERPPRAVATGVINDYHSSLGVQARQAVTACAAARGASGGVTSGANGSARLEIRYHSLYFERFYSTEEHCAYRYILLSPGSHALWLDHMKQKLLCGSLVMLLEPQGAPPERFQYDVLTRLLVPGVHYLTVPLPDLNRKRRREQEAARRALCDNLHAALDWADLNPLAAQRIAMSGQALVREVLTMPDIYAYMKAALTKAAALIGYSPLEAMEAFRLIGTDRKRLLPFNRSNITRVPMDAPSFVRSLRNDTFVYPRSAQIKEQDWADVVLFGNFSRMGADFTKTAKEHREEVQHIRQEQARVEADARKARDAQAASRRRDAGAKSGRRRTRNAWRGRGPRRRNPGV